MPLRYCDTAPSSYHFPLLLRHLLRSAVDRAPQQEIVYGARRLTYRDLEKRTAALGGALSRLGIRQGSTVAVMDWDSHRYLECFLGVPMLGAVLMTVNVRLSPDQIAYTVQHSDAELLIIHEDFAALAPSVLAAAPNIRHVIWATDSDLPKAPPIATAGDYETLLMAEPASFDWVDFDENAMAVTFYTTGTTGSPKAVAFSHRQILLKTLVMYGAWAAQVPGQSFRQCDVYMPITPMFHVQAWGFPYVALLLGVKHVYPGRYDPSTLLRLRRDEGVTFSHCVPTLLDSLLRAPESAATDLTGWKICVGGTNLNESLAKSALERGVDVFAAYGLSETYAGTLLTGFVDAPDRSDPSQQLAIRCKAGRALPFVDLRIIDIEMRSVARDDQTVGEIVVRMPWATTAYQGLPEASEDLWRGGYLHTQDLARIDADGYVTIVDRSKDVIKSGGEWISSLELERLLMGQSGVVECAVIASADEHWGERPMALVVVMDDAPSDIAQRLREHLYDLTKLGHLSRLAVPEQILIVPYLPKTSVGKLDKKALRDTYSRDSRMNPKWSS